MRFIHSGIKGNTNLTTVDRNLYDLTVEERNKVCNLPFFSASFEEQSTKRLAVAKQRYIDKKIPLIKAIFKEDAENTGYLNHRLPSNMAKPYHDVYCKRAGKTAQGISAADLKPRLSVTKLLTKRWCELREAYDIYSSFDVFAHPQLLKGVASHQKLEDETHPVSEEIQTFMDDFEMYVPSDEFHKFSGLWTETMTKMMNLFIDGEAREILCHGYLDSTSGHLKAGPIEDENNILISAVVDHLVLRKRISHSNLVPFKLDPKTLDWDDQDISKNLKCAHEQRAFLRENFEIVVSDVKTRSFRRIPSQENVLKATKLQVMYYRFFLEELATDPDATYGKLLINAERRGFDVDQPIDPAKVISLMAKNSTIIADMKRLRDGAPIGFKLFDDFNIENVNYDMSSYSDVLTEKKTLQAYQEFFREWAKPVTLRYLAARLSQVYHEVGALLGNTLMVEYYVRDENFHNTVFDYDYKHLMENCHDSANFWLGKRDIEPIKPTVKNILTYCKHCDYAAVCSWKKLGTENCEKLGDELIAINEGRSPQE